MYVAASCSFGVFNVRSEVSGDLTMVPCSYHIVGHVRAIQVKRFDVDLHVLHRSSFVSGASLPDLYFLRKLFGLRPWAQCINIASSDREGEIGMLIKFVSLTGLANHTSCVERHLLPFDPACASQIRSDRQE
jgi:hypothetical protein